MAWQAVSANEAGLRRENRETALFRQTLLRGHENVHSSYRTASRNVTGRDSAGFADDRARQARRRL
jgi:hypothetical protein